MRRWLVRIEGREIDRKDEDKERESKRMWEIGRGCAWGDGWREKKEGKYIGKEERERIKAYENLGKRL